MSDIGVLALRGLAGSALSAWIVSSLALYALLCFLQPGACDRNQD